jgi:hypothetical protein
VYYDKDLDTFPFAITFFLFKAGLHKEAIDFLMGKGSMGISTFPDWVRSFGKIY